jgi:HEAT repeat protein
MAKDARTTLDGRPLRDWLLDLVTADPRRREAAGEALRAARVGMWDAGGDILAPDAAAAAWREAVGRQFAAPGFPGGPTATHLARWLLKINTAYLAKVEAGQDLDFDTEETLTAAAMAAGWVLECVGPGGATAVPALVEMLAANGGNQAWLASEALGGIGPAAAAAVSPLVKAICRAGADERPYRKGRALSAIAGDDPQVVRTLAERLTDPRPTAREGACAALAEFGPKAAAAVPALVTATRHAEPGTRSHAAIALAAVAAGRADVVDVLLPLTRDPEWFVRGNAIGSLGRLGLRLPEVVPAFVAALDDVGGDGDWTVREQALDALARAGADAAPAMPKLLAQLGGKDDGPGGDSADVEPDVDLVRALGKLGAVARDALPDLRALLREAEPESEAEFELAEAVKRIERAVAADQRGENKAAAARDEGRSPP